MSLIVPVRFEVMMAKYSTCSGGVTTREVRRARDCDMKSGIRISGVVALGFDFFRLRVNSQIRPVRWSQWRNRQYQRGADERERTAIGVLTSLLERLIVPSCKWYGAQQHRMRHIVHY